MVDQMARIFRDNDHEIRPVLKALLTSAHFFDEATIGARIKSPVELVAGTARTLSMWAGQDIRGEYMSELSKVLGQWLLDPPNVAGWPGYRIWVSTTTLPERHLVTDEIVDNRPRPVQRETYPQKAPRLDLFIRSFPEPYDAVKLVRALGECLTPFQVDKEREELFLTALLKGADVYDWDPNSEGASRRIAALMKLIFELPDYHLT